MAVERPPPEAAGVMRGRAMQGWLRVDPADHDIPRWVARGAAAAKSKPPKG